MTTDRGDEGEVYADFAPLEFTDIPGESPIVQFLDYWRAIAKSARMPARADLDPVDIPTILPWMFLIDVLRQENDIDFRYRLTGTRNADLVRQDATGKLVGEAFPEATAVIMKRSYMEVVERGEPLCWQATVPEKDRAFIACYRALFPFSSDGQTVDLIAGILMPIDRRHI